MKLWFERGAWASKKGRLKIGSVSSVSVKRIVVIRHAALGDMVLVRPFLTEARKFFPNAEIILSIVSNYAYGAPVDLVDQVHILPGSDQRQAGFREHLVIAKKLGKVDILFDLADTTRSRYLTWITRASLKIGFPYRWYLRHFLFDATVPRSDFSFEAVNMLDTLMLLGANPVFPLEFGWSQINLKSLEEISTPYVVYFPFASVITKRWPIDAFRELIWKMSESFPDITHLILSGNKSDERAMPLFELFREYKNVTILEAMELSKVVQILRNSSLTVSSDSGIRNLAISTQTPTVGIFFSTVPFRYWPRDELHQVIFEAEGSVPSVDRVFEACSAVLRRNNRSEESNLYGRN